MNFMLMFTQAMYACAEHGRAGKCNVNTLGGLKIGLQWPFLKPKIAVMGDGKIYRGSILVPLDFFPEPAPVSRNTFLPLKPLQRVCFGSKFRPNPGLKYYSMRQTVTQYQRSSTQNWEVVHSKLGPDRPY